MSDAAEGRGVVLLRATGHRRYRWRNGLGAATEIAVEAVGGHEAVAVGEEVAVGEAVAVGGHEAVGDVVAGGPEAVGDVARRAVGDPDGQAVDEAGEGALHAPVRPGWTLSIATVESDVAFSSFPGVDRRLMALSAGGLGLLIDGEPVELTRWEVAAFDGASVVASRGVVGPTLDLNLMVSRNRFRGSLEAVVVQGSMFVTTPAGSITFVVLLDGRVSVAEHGALDRHDTLRLESGSLTLTGEATIALARVLPHP